MAGQSGGADAASTAQPEAVSAVSDAASRAASASASEAAPIIELLGLQPHPEGGFFAETWRDEPADRSRGVGTAIYYLLRAGDVSAWHRHDAVEVWHHYAGAPLELLLARELTTREDPTRSERHVLGPDLGRGERPQVVVPAGSWQYARSLGSWTLVGCTVSPAFSFESFELADAARERPG